MSTKENLLSELRSALDDGIVTDTDVRSLLTPATTIPAAKTTIADSNQADKLSASDIMFYLGGLVLFAGIMVALQQSWSDGGPFSHIGLSAGIGIIAWVVAAVLIRKPVTDIRRGLVNTLLLVGSLSIIVGGFVITYEVTPSHTIGFVGSALALAAVGMIHLFFGYKTKRTILVLLGILLSVAVFPTVIFRFLDDAHAPLYLWCLTIAVTAGILAQATRTAAKYKILTKQSRTTFDSLATFIALGALYAASFGDILPLLWLLLLIGAIIGIFYLSIALQKQLLLGNASLFLVITIITIAFRYFSSFGITTSLVIAAFGLIATAAVATSLNKKYFTKTV